jgi:hypothetical protein
MTVRHCQWRFANAPLTMTSLIFLIFSYLKNKIASVEVACSPTSASNVVLDSKDALKMELMIILKNKNERRYSQ